MKKFQMKRSDRETEKVKELKKPFGFCCDVKNQDAKTQYNTRNPPFASTMSDAVVNGDGPVLKIRLQHFEKTYNPFARGLNRIKSAASYLGECPKCRGPLHWYLQDEIWLARRLHGTKRTNKHNKTVSENCRKGVKRLKRLKELGKDEAAKQNCTLIK